MMNELDELAEEIKVCTKCRLAKGRINAVHGEGPSDARMMLIGEAPGRSEDQAGRPFCGSAGRILDRALHEAGIKREAVFITNIVKCRPPNNRKPVADEIKSCLPYLVRQINIIKPEVIVALGSVAKESVETLCTRDQGNLRIGNAFVFQTYHPAAVLYGNKKAYEHLVSELAKAAQSINAQQQI